MNDSVLRETLVKFLEGGHAYAAPREILEGIRSDLRTARPPGLSHSAWELIEHLRIAQEDILRYTLDSAWRSPEFPEGYWPRGTSRVTDEEWAKSLSGFYSDLNELIAMVRDESVDLTAELPHGEGRTYLRQVLLVIDHNSHHLGQLVQVRKALGNW